MRLDKLICELGLASRREAARLCRAGRVQHDGVLVRDPSRHVDPLRPVTLERRDGPLTRCWQPEVHLLVHKPAGLVSSASDRDGPSVLGLVPENFRGRELAIVGRLDQDTTGLLLLTTDGTLAHRLTHPRWKVPKLYHARLDRPLPADADRRLADGSIELDGKPCTPAQLARAADDACRVSLTLTEGRFHQVKRMMHALGSEVLELHRDRFGPLELGELELGQVRELTPTEALALRQATGLDPA